MKKFILVTVIAAAALIVNAQPWPRAQASSAGGDEGPICSLPADSGPCDGDFPRWYHNSATGLCEPFSYGGCEGNANNFETLVECQHACMDICSLPAVYGPCQAAIHLWHFNAAAGGCEQFIYGGCNGNANQFLTLAECERTCGGVTSPCQHKLAQGPCGDDPGWYYEPTWFNCFQIPSGWCGSDINRFDTKEECLASCFSFCHGDLNHDGVVNVFDLLILISEWGKTCQHWNPCLSDLDFNGMINVHDLLALLSLWGPCPTEPPW